MIVLRNVFRLKPGRAGEFARQMTETMQSPGGGPQPAAWRVLTDLSGPFDTVVFEMELDSLATWERNRAEVFAQPAFRESFERTADWIVSGSAEFYTIEGRS